MATFRQVALPDLSASKQFRAEEPRYQSAPVSRPAAFGRLKAGCCGFPSKGFPDGLWRGWGAGLHHSLSYY